jgi:uroporphyrin-III C-methyltransferase
MPHNDRGRVLLVGAGPGAADLLTIRALRAIESADVILLDALVSDSIRCLIPHHIRQIEVGKRGHRPSAPQDFVNRLMAQLAKSGASVVRLKGGDPSIFGRSGEECAFLREAGVSVEIVPGVTTASAAAAQFGFPLTTRGEARRILFATGRTLAGPSGDWDQAADAETTLCLYMGCTDIDLIVQKLLAAGRAGSTPALVAFDVERPGARMIATTLAQLSSALSNQQTHGPVFITIGAACANAMNRDLAEPPALAQDLRAC